MHLSPFLKRALEDRKLKPEEYDVFLSPNFERDSHDPFLLTDMDKAVSILIDAVKGNKKVGIFSDYDADGIPSAVMMADFFEKIGFNNFKIYIPDRLEDGFGINKEAVDQIAKDGCEIMLTLDCGVTDILEVRHARSLGLTVIITDHHEPKSELPEAHAVIDPKRLDDKYPFKHLCGAGVGWKLIQGILIKDRLGLAEGQEKWFLDLVSLATISDMVPLIDENRMLVRYGLLVLRKGKRIGLRQLFIVAGAEQKNATEDDVAFSLTPRINAASRMGKASDALNLLLEKDEVKAKVLAKNLESLNADRKKIVAVMSKAMKKSAREKEHLIREHGIVVLGDPAWRPSLLGLAANSLVEDFDVPVFLWGRENGSKYKGSCRSCGRKSVIEIMQKAEGVFDDFGGHFASGGFTVNKDKIHEFEMVLTEAISRVSDSNILEEEILNDFKLEEINDALLCDMELLAPFGIGNPKPIFKFSDIEIKKARKFGKENNHLELQFMNESGEIVKAIKFFNNLDIENGKKINLKANIEKNTWNGANEVRLRIIDIR